MSVNARKHAGNVVSRGRKKQPQDKAPASVTVHKPNPDFERQLQDHFTAEARKKVEEEAENIFGSLLARHGWIRNERGQVEYVGGEGA